MSRSDEKRLNDIRRMCATAADLVGRGRAAIESDPALWLALERVIEIAGEAATNIGDDTRSQYADVPWRELAATRVLLAHAGGSVLSTGRRRRPEARSGGGADRIRGRGG